jgi:Xaa-Pro dipeptidase
MERASLGKEYQERLSKLCEILKQGNLEGVLIYSSMLRRENVRYFTNFNPTEPGALVLFSHQRDPVLMVPLGTERARAQSSSWIHDIASYDGDFKKIPLIIKKRYLPKRMGVAGWEYWPVDLVGALQSAFPDMELIDITPSVHGVRIIKTDSEIQKIQKAAAIADASYENLINNLKPGIKEYEIVALVEYDIRKAHGEDNFQILASSPGDARAMHPPTNRTLMDGDLLITEISPQYKGYFAQICRSIVIGAVSVNRQKAHNILYRAQQNAIDEVKQGLTASDVAKIQNDVFRQEGLAEYVTEEYTRARGHGIGLYIDEEPLIAEGNDFELKPGMVIMIHPNTYLPLSGYMVLGDPVLITEKGGKRLSHSRRDLIAIQ